MSLVKPAPRLRARRPLRARPFLTPSTAGRRCRKRSNTWR